GPQCNKDLGLWVLYVSMWVFYHSPKVCLTRVERNDVFCHEEEQPNTHGHFFILLDVLHYNHNPGHCAVSETVN
ncbi:hypothetical protein AGIG_G27064, partial [Arapaima gigas]